MNKNKEIVTLSKPKEEWPKSFQLISKIISDACGGLIKRIEHIGSTAISGIKAKHIIDIQCGVTDFSQQKELIQKLRCLGLGHLSHVKQDHVPFHDFDYYEQGWEKLFFRGSINNISCNVHIRIINNPNWAFALQFRDYLKQNKHVATVYEEIKIRLVSLGIDTQTYCFIKDPVCDLIYQAIIESRRSSN